MKKFLLFVLLQGVTISLFAQKDFNQWSFELNGGFNKPMGPLTPGYFSPTLNLGHADIGLRYMLNENFGFSGGLGLGNFSESKGTLPFSTNYVNLNLSGVFNIGRMMNFQSFSPRLTMLSTMGFGMGALKQEDRIIGDYDPDYVYSLTGTTALLYKISNKVSLQGKISATVNGRQRYTFDGNEFNQNGRPDVPEIPYIHATGTWWTGTLGLNFYLGKNEQHADWYIAADKYATKEELTSQITSIKDLLKDSDGDGVSDFLDKEPNTPAGAHVSFHGITLDSDSDGLADHLDKCPFLPGPSANDGCPIEEIKEQVDYFQKAINDGYVNTYFAFDSATPLSYSQNSLGFVSNFLKKNPSIKLELKGYADELGGENYNIQLSEKRAKSVYDILIASGIDSSRLTYKGYGEDTSVDKKSADARQMARRVSFEIK